MMKRRSPTIHILNGLQNNNMVNDERIRVSKEFKALLMDVRILCMQRKRKIPSNADITKKITKMLNPEEIYQDEYA